MPRHHLIRGEELAWVSVVSPPLFPSSSIHSPRSGSVLWLLSKHPRLPHAPTCTFKLHLLAILTARGDFTAGPRAAPPTNLPLSLLWESLVIAVGLNTWLPATCVNVAFRQRQSRIVYCHNKNGSSSEALLWVFMCREKEEAGGEQEERTTPHFTPLLLLHMSFLLNFFPVMDLIWVVCLSRPPETEVGTVGTRREGAEGATAAAGAGNGTGWARVFWSTLA